MPCTRSAVSLCSRVTLSSIRTWMRRMTRTLSSSSTSPVTRATRWSDRAGIWRASSAPPKVPSSQPPVAPMTWSMVVACGS